MARTVSQQSMPVLLEDKKMASDARCSSLLHQLANRQRSGKLIRSGSFNYSSTDYIRSYQPFVVSWLKQYATLEKLTHQRAETLLTVYLAKSKFVETSRSFGLLSNCAFIDAYPNERSLLLDKLLKIREAVSIFRSHSGFPPAPDLHLERELFAILLLYFDIPAVLTGLVTALANSLDISIQNSSSVSQLPPVVKVCEHMVPDAKRIVCLAIDVLRRVFSAGEVKEDGTRRDEEHARRFVIGEYIHRIVSADGRCLKALLKLFLVPVEDKVGRSLRYQSARLAEDCLVFAPPSSIDIPNLFSPFGEFKDVVACLPDSDLPQLCRLILPAICEFDAYGPPPHSLSRLHHFRTANADRLAIFDTNISFILSLAGADFQLKEEDGSNFEKQMNAAESNFISIEKNDNLLGRLLLLATSPVIDNLGLPILPRPLSDSTAILRPMTEPGDYWTRYITARMILGGRRGEEPHESSQNYEDSAVDDDRLPAPLSNSLAHDTVIAIRSRMTIFQFLSHALASKCRYSMQKYIASTNIIHKLEPIIFSLRFGASIPDTAPSLFLSCKPPFTPIVIPPSQAPHRRFGGPLSPEHVPDMLLSVVVLRFLHALCDHSPYRRQLLGYLDFLQIAKFDPSDEEAKLVVDNPSLASISNHHGILTYICFSVVYHKYPADLWYWLIRVIEAYLRSSSPGDQMLVAYSGVLQRIVELILAPNGYDSQMRHQPSNLEVFQCSFDLLAEIVKFNVRLTNDADSMLEGPGQRYFVLRLVSENLVDANMFLRSLILTHCGHFHSEWFSGSSPALSPIADDEPGDLLKWIGSFDIRVRYVFSLVTCFSAGVSSVTQDNISCLNTAILCLLLSHRATTDTENVNVHNPTQHCKHESLPAYLAALAAFRPVVSLPAPAAYRNENAAATASWLASGADSSSSTSASHSFSTETASRRRLLIAAASDEAEFIVGATWLRLFRDLLHFWRTHYLAKDKDSSSLARSTRIPFERWHALVNMLLDESRPAPATSIARFLNAPFRAE